MLESGKSEIWRL